MRKMTVLVMIGLVLMLAVAVAVAGAMPDEGDSSGRASIGRGISTEKAIVDCLTGETGGLLTRQELKELRVELAMYGNSEARPAALVACALSNQVSTR